MTSDSKNDVIFATLNNEICIIQAFKWKFNPPCSVHTLLLGRGHSHIFIALHLRSFSSYLPAHSGPPVCSSYFRVRRVQSSHLFISVLWHRLLRQGLSDVVSAGAVGKPPRPLQDLPIRAHHVGANIQGFRSTMAWWSSTERSRKSSWYGWAWTTAHAHADK